MKRRTELIALAVLSGPLVVVAVLIGVTHVLDFSAPSIKDTHGFEVLDTRFGFDVGTAAKDVAELEETARQMYRRFELFDYLFMAFYTAVLILAIRAVTVSKTILRKLALLPVVAGVSDAVEDVAILIALGSKDPSRAALTTAHWAGIFKYAFLGLALVALAFLVTTWIWRREQMRYKPEDSIKQTYFSLRLALTLLVVMLLLALAIEAIPPWCALHSISAYYYTPLQSTFVGTLVAIGICLVVYQGTTYMENLLLDIAGFMAFIVAFSPTAKPHDEHGNGICESSVVEVGATQADIVRGNVLPLLLVALVATFIVLMTRINKDDDDPESRRKELTRLVAGLTAQIIIIAAFFTLRDQFESKAHGIAATTLFICVIAVVLSNHRGRMKDPTKTKWRYIYLWVAIAMGVTLAACVAAHLLYTFPHWILAIEIGLIVEFAAFWAIQTADLRGAVRRPVETEEPAALTDVPAV